MITKWKMLPLLPCTQVIQKLQSDSSLRAYQHHWHLDFSFYLSFLDTSFYPTQLNYGLPNSPDSYVSIKTPISPSAALCTMDSPALMEPSSSLPLPTITPAVSTTIPTSNYFFNETQSSSYSNFFNTADIQQPQQSEQQFLSHHYSHQNEDRDQVQLQHLLQPYYHPRKKTRRLSITSGALSPTQQDNTPFMKTTPHSPRSPPQATPPAPREKKKLPTRSMEEIGSNEPGFSLENESTPSPSSPTGLNRVSQIKDGSAHEENEYEHSNIVQQMATPSTTKTSAEATPLNNGGNSTTEIRRQIHIQSEQKRRAQIKCGFDELRNELPVCLNKKMSKVTLLHRSKCSKVLLPLHDWQTNRYLLW